MHFNSTSIKNFIFSLVLGTACSHLCHAQWQPPQKIVAADRENLSVFGGSVAVSGDYAIVGAHGEDEDANGNFTMERAGAAYIFHKEGTTWKQVKKIVAPVRSSFMLFGSKVAISGNVAVVGAPYETINGPGGTVTPGAVYIFQKDAGGTDSWGLVKKINAPQPQHNVNFGAAVAISGDYVLTSAPYETDATPDNSLDFAGAAYLYRKDQGGANNWGLVKRILSSDRSGSDQFGYSVAISGDKAIIGAMQEAHDVNGSNMVWAAGSAYIFEKNSGGTDSWGQVKKITAPIRAEYDYFGASVSINGDYVVVGANQESEDLAEVNTVAHAGSAYVFKKGQGGASNWGLVRKITASYREPYQNFGKSVSIQGNFIVVGADYDDTDANGNNPVSASGSAFIFENSGSDNWAMTKKITATSRDGNEGFGNSVAIDGTNIIVGAGNKSDDQNNANPMLYAGAAFLFHNDAILPVTLSHFEAQKIESQAHLSWTTTEETNSSHFDIQRSANGRNWVTLETVKAANESRVTTPYYSFDKSPFVGQNLYRLKMVDNDGTFAYSKIEALTFDGAQNALFYPNPAADRLHLSDAVLKTTASLKLLDQTGKAVFQTSRPTVIIQTGHISGGLYVLQITKTDGSITSSPVIIGQR